MQRNTREDMSIPGSVFDCQPARRVPEEIIQRFKKFGSIIGDSEKKRN